MPTLAEFLQQAEPLARQSAVPLSVFFAAIMLFVSDWRIALMAFAGLQVLAGLLLTQLLPPEWALLQWVVGGLVGIMWYLSARRLDTIRRRQQNIPWWKPMWRLNPSTLMRLTLVVLLLTFIAIERPVLQVPRLPADLARFSTYLALAGLVGLGLGDRPLRWGLSLMMWILAASFAIHALQVEADTVGILAGLQIVLGFGISYLIIVDGARFWPRPEDV
ncbi:MAG: hypothetical protein D6775_13965 [Caldilineae bacterium]|nr:MAG: hypothetical protein D6775_13965 [Caldilineae bacterium]